MEKLKKPGFIDKFRERLRLMLSLDYTPRQIALSSALGIALGFSPYIGLQSYMAVGISSYFKLPIYPILAGSFITNPLTIPILYPLIIKFGMWLLNVHVDYEFNFSSLNLREMWEAGKSLLLPFFVAGHIIGIVLGIFTYFIVYYIVKKYKSKPARKSKTSKESKDNKSSSADTSNLD